MLTIKSPADVQDLLDLALDISELESCSWKDAVRRAVELKPRLACDIENDVRYEPAIEVHTSWSIPPRQLIDLTVPAARQIVAVG